MLSPVLVFGLAVAVDLEEERSPMAAIGAAIPEIAIGLVAGLAVGAVLAGLANVAERRNLMTDQSRRICWWSRRCWCGSRSAASARSP
ncbi:MAG: hypothetical protein K2X52_11305 [Mycobacteriaceae bacterium]|nr:hypothetical protein [Mycobacteriaceae bacterium]